MPPIPLDLLAERAGAILKSGSVLADEKPAAVLPDVEDLKHCVMPLLEWCRQRQPTAARGIVGIAAPCGAGKTLLMSWLAAVVRALEWHEFAFAGLDGYHLPNSVLDQRTGVGPNGEVMPLRLLKGTPATFDAERFIADLRALKADRSARALPVYSRLLHEPVPNRIRIEPEVQWVFVEGNFLLLDMPPWHHVRDLLDRRVYLDASDELLRQRLAARHAAAGRDAAWIEAHFRRTDGPNIRLIRAHAHNADVVLRWNSDGRLREDASWRRPVISDVALTGKIN